MSWPIIFFKETERSLPVQIWLDGLSPEVRGKMLGRIDLLKDHGPTLDFPFTSQVEGKMREVRLRFGKTRYRVLYFFDPDRVGVLLHGFTKDTEAIEEADKVIGRRRMKSRLAHLQTKEKRTKSSSQKKKKRKR